MQGKSILDTLKKRWNLASCDNMGGSGVHYTKWNKSDRERQLPYDFTHIHNIGK